MIDDDTPAVSKAVAESLSALSEVIDDQSRAIASLGEDIMAAMIALVREANALTVGDTAEAEGEEAAASGESGDTVRALAEAAAAATAPRPVPAIDFAGHSENVAQILETAYANTVTAQQQLYVVGQAALTQGIALLYSVVAAATGKVEAAELKILLGAIGAPKPRQ